MKMGENWVEVLKKVRSIMPWVLSGALLAIVLGQYPGSFEVNFGDGKGYVKVEGVSNGRCEIPDTELAELKGIADVD